MTLVFTICSSNYLAHAKVLGDSLAQSNPDCRFVIGLVDRIPSEVDFDSWMVHEVLPVSELGIDCLDEMAAKYNIVELNTAVKPFYMEYFYEQDASVEHVFYIDPDIMVLGSFSYLIEKLKSQTMVVTPHSCTYDDGEANIKYEIAMLSTGVFNLGFIATRRDAETMAFIKWWQIRLREYCLYQKILGVFVDQLWVSLAPLYFPGLFVEKNPGYNMSYWNHFERNLTMRDGTYWVNDSYELIFYHFSSYSIDYPDQITSRADQMIFTFAERPDLEPLFEDYRQRLVKAGIEDVRHIKCMFQPEPKPEPKPEPALKSGIKRTLNMLTHMLPARCRHIIGRAAGAIMRSCKS